MRVLILAASVFSIRVICNPSQGPTLGPRPIFKGDSNEDHQSCSVVEPDISSKIALSTLDKWRFDNADQGYKLANSLICFLHLDQNNEMSILLGNRDSYGTDTLAPPGGKADAKGKSLIDTALYWGKPVMPSLQESDLHLLNAVYTAHPSDTSDTPTQALYTSFAVFVKDKSQVKTGNRKWYRIQGESLINPDGTTADNPWFYTKEILLSVQDFVDCPGHPAEKTPDWSAPVLPDPQQKDLKKQQQFFNDRGCKVEGSDIVYRKNINKLVDCHPALMYEMERVCGDNKFAVTDPFKVQCLIHGASTDYNWTPPRPTYLDIEPELWTASVLDSYRYDFRFGWMFGYSLSNSEDFGGMVAILTLDNPDNCVYQNQTGGVRLDKDVDRSKGVTRFRYSSATYRNVHLEKIPDAWIYPSYAVRNCDIRLVNQYYFRPFEVPKRNLVKPVGCSVKPVFFHDVSEDLVNRWHYTVANQGIPKAIVLVLPVYYDDVTKSVYLASMLRTGTIKFESTKFVSGASLKFSAAMGMQDLGFGDIRAKDMHLLGAYKYRPDLRAVYAVFLPNMEELGTPNRLKWRKVTDFKFDITRQLPFRTEAEAVIDALHCH